MSRFEVRIRATRKGASCSACGREASIIVSAQHAAEAVKKALDESGYDKQYFTQNAVYVRQMNV